MLPGFAVSCDDCGEEYLLQQWMLKRTMIEGVEGHSAYRYVYHLEHDCQCGLDLVVEAQGFQGPFEDFVDRWMFRHFNCEIVRELPDNLTIPSP